MTRKARTRTTAITPVPMVGYDAILTDVVRLLETARRAAARTVNAVMTATYWEIGRRIVEYEQAGARRAEYGAELLERLSADLTRRFGKGFSVDNLERMRLFWFSSEKVAWNSPPPDCPCPHRLRRGCLEGGCDARDAQGR